MPSILEEWKRLSECDVRESSRPQEGRILVKAVSTDTDKEKVADLRVAFLPASLGETVTVRILDPSIVTLDLEKLQYAPWDYDKMIRALGSAFGIIICSGPVGSGKTTTLYTFLNKVNAPSHRVISIEDPVEYYLPWVTQVDLSKSPGMTFDSAFKAMMRSDPDVILVGELRDPESVQHVQNAATTGHLVLTQLHADGAIEALMRLINAGADTYLLSSVLRLIVSQRLVRKLCPDCAKFSKKAPSGMQEALKIAKSAGYQKDDKPAKYGVPKGCKSCADMGYRGRAVISEVLEVSPAIEKALLECADPEELRKIAIENGMRTIFADGIRRVVNGETSLEEIYRVIRPH